METPKFHGRVIVGLVLIILGAVFVLRNYNMIEVPEDIFSWEYFFILLGVLFIFLSRNKTVGFVLLALGLFNLLPDLFPLVFVLIGAYIIFGRGGFKKSFSGFSHSTSGGDTPQSESKSDYFESISIFGGGSKIVNSNNFKGGNIVSIFGGSEINLLNCKLAEGENNIEITAIFGGSTLIVPSDWKVELDVLPIFGGFGDRRMKDPNKAYQEGRTLVIKGLVIFGGGEIKTIF